MDDELDNITIDTPVSPVGPAQNAQARPGVRVYEPECTDPTDPRLAVNIPWTDIRALIVEVREFRRVVRHYRIDAMWPALKDRLILARAQLDPYKSGTDRYYIEVIDRLL